MNILDYAFGNKIKIVTATSLRSFMEFEQKFVFHKELPYTTIRKYLWEQKHYSIEDIKITRSKEIISPKINCGRELTKEKRIRFFDD